MPQPRRSIPGELGPQGAERPTPVADAVLLLVGELRHRLVPARREEDRVVAEARTPPALAHQHSLADRFGVAFRPAGPRDRGDAPIACRPPAARDARDRPHQGDEVLLVARSLSGEAGAARSRFAAQRIDLDPG